MKSLPTLKSQSPATGLKIKAPNPIKEERESPNTDLLEKENRRFKQAYHTHFLDGETKPKNIGEPFLLRNTSSKAGILLIHGLMAAPEEVRQWAQFLYSKGYTVYGPRLAGHGTSAIDLSTRNYAEWMESVDRGIDILRTCCKRVIIGGFSTGAGLALYQAIQKPTCFDGVISISAPLKFKGVSANFVEVLHAWNQVAIQLGMARFTKKYAQNHPDNPHINYHRCPIQGIVQVKTLMKKVYDSLSTLKIPSLIIQGKNDPKVDGKSGKKIFQRINRMDSHYREINFHRHGIVRGPIAKGVFQEVETFLNTLYPEYPKDPAPH